MFFHTIVYSLQHKRENADTLLMELQNQLNETKLEMTSVKERLAVEFSVDLDAILREETISEIFYYLDSKNVKRSNLTMKMINTLDDAPSDINQSLNDKIFVFCNFFIFEPSVDDKFVVSS